jgi:putative hemolysin
VNLSQHIPLFLTVIILLFFSAFFSGSETAFFSLSRSAVAGMKASDRRRRMIAALLSKPRMLLVTVLFGNLLVNIASTSAVTALAISLFGEKGVGIAVVVMTALILVFGEITPKSLALKNAESFAVNAAPLLRALMIVFSPFRFILETIATATVRKSRRLFGERREEYEARELATAVEMGHDDGLFDKFETEVLTNLFLFTETTVREILVPRVEVFALNVDTPLGDAVIQVRSRGFSRVPLFKGDSDNIVGILMAKDLLRYSRDERVTLEEIMRAPIFVPESKKIRDLFWELIASHQHFVVAVDEHGSFEGIVSLEDILEEIFGEIRNRREPKVEEYLLTGRDQIIVDGTMELEHFNEVFDVCIESKEVETVAGYLIEQVGKIPREGESITLKGLRFLALSSDRTRLKKLKVERVPERSEGEF